MGLWLTVRSPNLFEAPTRKGKAFPLIMAAKSRERFTIDDFTIHEAKIYYLLLMLEVSFNSPQCGWMSIGFDEGVNEFHTTTAHAPHQSALPELMRIMASLADGGNPKNEFVLKWNRDPEEFDFSFVRDGDNVLIEIYQYPTDERDAAERELVFSHTGSVTEIVRAFGETFEQLYEDRETDEFEFNWRQPFPYREFESFKTAVTRS